MEIIVEALNKEKERPYRQVTSRTAKTNIDEEIVAHRNELENRELKRLKYNDKYSIAVDQLTINVSIITGTLTQASYGRTQKRRHADESILIRRQDTTRQLRKRERTRTRPPVPEPPLEDKEKETGLP